MWWYFWEVDENDSTEERLSSFDKRWLLYWNFMTCMGVLILFMIVIGINNIRVTRQNGKDVEEAISMIATYMASATKDEYDKIAQTIRHDLVFSEYGEDIENFIQYIPNTAETCRICMESYPAQAVLVCANTGQFYSLDLYDIGESPDNSSRGGTIMNFGYDEVSQTSVHITKSPDQKTGYAEIDRGRGIVSVHRMKALFCDDCIWDILNTVEHQLIEEFFIFDTEKRTFSPIDDSTTLQIGDYHLDIEYKDSDYRIDINYTSE
ncbi:hypothetical protein [uncultured Phocaeicola sp.]|nr:hypothetical protein [uncultured Phocaeicola sp.]